MSRDSFFKQNTVFWTSLIYADGIQVSKPKLLLTKNILTDTVVEVEGLNKYIDNTKCKREMKNIIDNM